MSSSFFIGLDFIVALTKRRFRALYFKSPQDVKIKACRADLQVSLYNTAQGNYLKSRYAIPLIRE
jgi:hypothetical protein